MQALEPGNLVTLALKLVPSPSDAQAETSRAAEGAVGDPSTLSPTSTPRAIADDAGSHTTLSKPLHALALLVHSIHSALDFRLVEPKPTTASSEGDDASTAVADANQLPPGWEGSPSNTSIQFKYRHQQSSLEFVISLLEMGGRALIAGVAVELSIARMPNQDNKSISYDVLLADYFSRSAFPLSLASGAEASSSKKVLADSFATPHRLQELINNYRINIIQRLVPGLFKSGYEELPVGEGSGSTTAASADRPLANPRGQYYPDPGGPLIDLTAGGGSGSRPRPAPEAPDHDPLRIPGAGGRGNPSGDVGRSDLLPLAGLGGTTGLGGANPFGGNGPAGSGMFVGPDHPMFGDHFGPQQGGVGGGGGRWGGDGFLPPGAVPPAARFDPIGPSAGGGGGVRGGFGGGRGGGSVGRGGRQGGPNWGDEFPPPGGSDYDDMFS
ncbi:BQ2448_318 [Microbotryum intermedium]|uniref:BQ2448_318 protein n=1 Tax=Microbotryum intermedium TaxID=269621 RepID=A0A238F5A4_9BASI|nr:BQ2448_318 [Microbotryum intermedium]